MLKPNSISQSGGDNQNLIHTDPYSGVKAILVVVTLLASIIGAIYLLGYFVGTLIK